MEEERSFTVLDGSQLRDPDLRSPVPNGAVSGERLLQLAESEASIRLYGLSLPDSLRSAAIRRINATDPGFLSQEFHDAGLLTAKVREFLTAISDELEDNPLAITILDGSALRLLLDDEDDFAMLAENIFTELDTDDNGRLSKNHISEALAQMGLEMGVPPLSEYSGLLSPILRKHTDKAEEHLGQSQFAQLLQAILQDLTDELARKHVVVIMKLKVINGTKLNKILHDEEIFSALMERLFGDRVSCTDGKESQEMLEGILLKWGAELGLPPFESNEAAIRLYDEIFSGVDAKRLSQCSDVDSFSAFLKDNLQKLVKRLAESPVFVDPESMGN